MQTATPKTDRRVVRTKRAIHSALAELIAQKDIAQITVSELAQTASISRKTFYNYYNTIYEVLDEIENDIVLDFSRAMQDAEFLNSVNDLSQFFWKLTDVVQISLEQHGHLMYFDRSGELVSKAVRAIKEETKRIMLLYVDIPAEQADLMLDYILWGGLTVYQMWYHSDHSRSIKDISRDIALLTWEGCKGYLDTYKK